MQYIFRAIVVFDYNPLTKEVIAPKDKFPGGNFNFCNFIPEDFALMSEYFDKVHKHQTGVLSETELTNYEVY